MCFVSELLHQSVVQQLILHTSCPIENMNLIEACATVTQIQLSDSNLQNDFRPDDIQQKLQAIASRNRQLARFVANPPAFPGTELMVLISQFDSIPTGRYMLARSFPGIDASFKIKSTDSTTAGPRKKMRRH